MDDKLERCVAQLTEKGYTTDQAYSICTYVQNKEKEYKEKKKNNTTDSKETSDSREENQK